MNNQEEKNLYRVEFSFTEDAYVVIQAEDDTQAGQIALDHMGKDMVGFVMKEVVKLSEQELIEMGLQKAPEEKVLN